jgi:DNA-binding beta-propeller fold protein YncE
MSLVLLMARGPGGSAPPIEPIQTVSLAGVSGRIDHLTLDPSGDRLFVAALGNNSVEVIDLRAGTRTRSLRGLAEPQGVVFVPGANRLFVACGGDGTVRVFDGTTLEPVSRIDLGSDADNIRYDSAAGRVFVGHGSGGLAVLDERGRRLGDIPLPAHPEAFALEERGPRIFINVPGAGSIEVADRETKAVRASWPLEQARANFPMALDEEDSTVFVGCRQPAAVLTVDTRTGRTVGELPVGGDPDDLFIDPVRKLLLVSSGSGELDVVDIARSDRLRLRAAMSTAPGARTSLFVPGSGRIYLAVPRRSGHDAEIRVYALPDFLPASGGPVPAGGKAESPGQGRKE